MPVVNVLEAKTHLSRLIARAEAGEDVVIARDGVAAVKLVPVTPSGRRRFGVDPAVLLPPDSAFFDDLPKDELAVWE
ncbi:MAG: type II toxin-antitoxin system Phd/YefM family antitoxin [Bifidobacteriaceae bacterium]|nr:type II toxin-antitoxin system Phd/YefM family antitoxin [Bifidobacteriaceae bacterium]